MSERVGRGVGHERVEDFECTIAIEDVGGIEIVIVNILFAHVGQTVNQALE